MSALLLSAEEIRHWILRYQASGQLGPLAPWMKDWLDRQIEIEQQSADEPEV